MPYEPNWKPRRIAIHLEECLEVSEHHRGALPLCCHDWLSVVRQSMNCPCIEDARRMYRNIQFPDNDKAVHGELRRHLEFLTTA